MARASLRKSGSGSYHGIVAAKVAEVACCLQREIGVRVSLISGGRRVRPGADWFDRPGVCCYKVREIFARHHLLI